MDFITRPLQAARSLIRRAILTFQRVVGVLRANLLRAEQGLKPLFSLLKRLGGRIASGWAFRMAGKKLRWQAFVELNQAALEKIRAGADLVQLYTGMVYEGPGLARRIVESTASTTTR